MCVHINVMGRRLHTLVDSGASRSMMRLDVYREYCKKLHRSPVLYRGETLRSLSGHELPTRGRSCIMIKGKAIHVYIVDRLFHDFLMGGDALESLEAVINYKEQTVTLAGDQYRYKSANDSDQVLALAETDADGWAREFPEVFSLNGQLGFTDSIYMTIDTGDCLPINQRMYRLPLKKLDVVKTEIDKMLREGIIEPSSSPWASPITLVPKKDGSTRFCVDYRKLNAVTKKDAHPLPHIQDIFDTLTGSMVFSTLDLKSGYWQVPVHPDSIEKTAFICQFGLFQFKRMPFGLTNAPALFQRMMNRILAPYIGRSVMVYLDDIVIFSRTKEEHKNHVKEVLCALQANNLTLNLAKCKFGLPEVKLLGFIVSQEGIRSDPEKTSAIRDMAPPRDVRAVRSFLGMTGYYRQCIPDYAHVAHPLVELTRKYAKFVWGERQHEAWKTLRDLLVSNQIMAHPQLNKPYKLYTDACDYAVGAILCQEDENGVERPVQYLSKQLSGSALHWATIEKEAYAVVLALQKLRPYLYSAKFTIYTDHKPLKSLFLSEVKNTKIQRWAVLLAEYGAPIEYRKGPNNIRADMLSRIRSDVEIARDSEFMCAVEEEEEIPWEFDQLEKDVIRREQQAMPEFRLGQEEEEEYAVHNGLLYTLIPPPGKPEYPRLVLPPSPRFRVIRRAHTEVGHQGMRKTLDRIQEAYKWPGMRKEVYQILSKCARCAVNRTRKDRPPPTAMPIANYPCQIVGMDMCGPFPESRHGNKYILTLIDHCTGWVEVKPLANKTAENVQRYLASEYIPRYGAPEVIITDQGLEFKNRLVEGYLRALGVDVRHSSPFHPQTNGKVERFHRTFKAILRTFVNARPGEWEDHLGATLWAHRVSTSVVTGFTPYFLTYGRRPNLPFSRIFPAPEGVEEEILGTRLLELCAAFKQAAQRTEESRRYNRERLEKQARAGDLKIGDCVVVLANESRPLDPKWDHGYTVAYLRGSVVTVIHSGGRKRTVNRDKVKLVDPEGEWDSLRVRLTRAKRKKKRRVHQCVMPNISLPERESTGGTILDLPCEPWENRTQEEQEGVLEVPDLPVAQGQQPDAEPGHALDDPWPDQPLNRTGVLTRAAAKRLAEPNEGIASKRCRPLLGRLAEQVTVKRPAGHGEGIASKRCRLPEERDPGPHKRPGPQAQNSTLAKRHRCWAPSPPTKRFAPEPEVVREEKRRCIQSVCSFFSALA